MVFVARALWWRPPRRTRRDGDAARPHPSRRLLLVLAASSAYALGRAAPSGPRGPARSQPRQAGGAVRPQRATSTSRAHPPSHFAGPGRSPRPGRSSARAGARRRWPSWPSQGKWFHKTQKRAGAILIRQSAGMISPAELVDDQPGGVVRAGRHCVIHEGPGDVKSRLEVFDFRSR